MMESPSQTLSQLTCSSEVSVTKDFLDMGARKAIDQLKDGRLVSSMLSFLD